MSRVPPTSRCLALLRAFDPTNMATAAERIDEAAAAIEDAVDARSFADLNEGQFAALIDFTIWKGADAFLASPLFAWVQNGNLTLPPDTLAADGNRGKAERDMWNLGNSE